MTMSRDIDADTYPVITSGDIDATIKERSSRYGDFTDEAVIAMALKNALRYQWSDDLQSLSARDGWVRLEPYQQHALELICLKMARIINGDPNYVDSWHDVAGYAKLVEDRLVKYGTGK